MKMTTMLSMPGDSWLSRSAAKIAYKLDEKQLDLITRELRKTGAYCARKGLASKALDQIVRELRAQS